MVSRPLTRIKAMANRDSPTPAIATLLSSGLSRPSNHVEMSLRLMDHPPKRCSNPCYRILYPNKH